MRRVILESPYRSNIDANFAYTITCMRDSLRRGEAPLASHVLYAQTGILDDADPQQRKLGIEAGLEWLAVADAMVVYSDRGISDGMTDAIAHAKLANVRVEFRKMEP